jgi:hypothetical protein
VISVKVVGAKPGVFGRRRGVPGLGIGLVLPLKELIEGGVDGLNDEGPEAIEKVPAVQRRQAALQLPADQVVEGVGLGVGLTGDAAVDGRQHVGRVEGLEGSPAAFFMDRGRVIDIKIRRIGNDEVESARHTWLTSRGLT